jgi:hypothetical protein
VIISLISRQQQGDNMRHNELARIWALYHGQTGTAKQVERIKKILSEDDLARMLKDRGITL